MLIGTAKVEVLERSIALGAEGARKMEVGGNKKIGRTWLRSLYVCARSDSQ